MLENALIPSPPGGQIALWRPESEQAKEFIRGSRAESTRRAYASAWRTFTAWCAACDAPVDLDCGPATAALVCGHLAGLAASGKAVASIDRAAGR